MRTANQLAEVRADFLRALRQPGGADVAVLETVNTGGTWDAERDQMIGATTYEKRTVYSRHALITPIRISEDPTADEGKTMVAFSEGKSLGNIGIGEVLVCKVRPELPLSSAFRYEIAGNTYKFDQILAVRAFGVNKPLWNLVKFIRG
jgi:hypothetical protein